PGPGLGLQRGQHPVHAGHQRRQGDLPVRCRIDAQEVGPAAPLVDRSAPVPARVVKAARRDLDEALVEAPIGTMAVRRPRLFPGLVGLPVETPVEELHAALQAHVASSIPITTSTEPARKPAVSGKWKIGIESATPTTGWARKKTAAVTAGSRSTPRYHAHQARAVANTPR